MAEGQEVSVIEKADVTLPPPGSSVRFTMLGTDRPTTDIVQANKQQMYGVYYEMYRQHPFVRAAVDKVAMSASKGGFIFHDAEHQGDPDETKARKLKRFFRNSNIRKLLRVTYKDLQVYGEAFWLIERSMNKAPFRAVRLNPRFTFPQVRGAKIVAWKYGTGPNKVIYDDRMVLHFGVDDLEDDVSGLSPLHSLQRSVAGDLNAMEYNGNFFENSAQTGIVFTMDNSDEATAQRNREYLMTHYVGTKNAHRPLLLEGGVTVTQSVSTQGEMEFGQYRLQNRQEILAVLGVDPTKLGMNESANRSTAKEAEDTFHTETVSTWQDLVEEEINNKLVLQIFGWDDIEVHHNTTDPRAQTAQLKTLTDSQMRGIFNVNEVRARIGLGPVKEGGDVYLMQTAAGLIPLSMVDEVATRLVVDNTAPAIEPTTGLGTEDNPPNPPVDDEDDE